MQDLLFEGIALQRIVLFSKLISTADCSNDEKDVALAWLGELIADLQKQLDEYEIKKAPVSGAISGGGFK